MKPKLHPLFIGLVLLASLAQTQPVKAALTFSVTPAAVSNTYTGTITLQIGGLTNGETVVIKKYLDVNTNGVIDTNDLMVQDFQLTVGQTGAMVIGGVTNVNVPFNSNTNTNAITAALNFQNGVFFHTLVGQYLFQVACPSGQITNSLAVTNSYAQKLTGRVVSGANAVPNAVVLLLPASGRAGNLPTPGAVANNSGFYTIQAPVGTYALAAFKDNFMADTTAATNLVLTNGQTLTTNLSLITTTESISGRITDATTGNGLPGVLVVEQSANMLGGCFTDTNGYFTAGATADQWVISGEDAAVALLGYVGWDNGVLVNATDGSVSNVTIREAKATALFYGYLTDNSGNPMAGVAIESQDQVNDTFGSTAANGYYVTGVLGGPDVTNAYEVDVGSQELYLNCIFSAPVETNAPATNVAVMVNFTAMNTGLVLNGGFQTKDFTDWTLTGDTYSTFVDDGDYSGITPYFGEYEAALETSGSLGYLSQTLSTTAGTSYLLSFWFDNPYANPGEFLVEWNGNSLLDTMNPVANDWTNMRFLVSATGTSTVLQFGYQDDRDFGYFGLDDISVIPGGAQSGFSYETNADNTITITGYTVLDGAVSIPSEINNLSVTSIGDYAFANTVLTSVTIPGSVTNIGNDAFSGCTNLTSVLFEGNAPTVGLDVFDGDNAVVYYLPGTTGWSLPFAGLPTDDEYDCTTNAGAITITSYSGPGGVVTIPATIAGLPVTGIGNFAFYDCYSLTSVTIPDSVTSIESNAFESCGSLTSVTIPNSVSSIGDEAFLFCTSLTNVTIPNSVTSIGEDAFSYCTSLTSVTIPDSVTNIGDGAFEGCTSLTAITVDAGNPVYSSVSGILFNNGKTTLLEYPGGLSGSYAIPDSVTSIGDYAFYGCTSLTSVTIPNSVTSIGDEAFSACGSLTAITVDAGNPVYNSVSGILFDNGETTLLEYPGGLSGSYAIPDSVTSIESNAFESCRSLTSVTIPNSVTNIGKSAFYDCTRLTSVTIGNSVTSIGNYAFYGCTSLTSVYFQGNAPTADSTVFNSDPTTVYYLPGTTGWGATFGGAPTALWLLANPLILSSGSNLGVQSNTFGFTISWATNTTVVVEASSNLANAVWFPVATNTLTNGSLYFSEPLQTNTSGLFYRISSP